MAAENKIMRGGDLVATLRDWVKGLVAAKYTKPSGGIPKSDLSSGVQSSLDKADSALQEHQSLAAYRKASEQDVIDLGLSNRVKAVEDVVPSQATSGNQLADKAFVNSSISTATATFRGTSATGLSEAQFLAWANGLTKDNNDYVFWNTTDADGNTVFKRYKYNGSTWAYEYSLNNSSFTSAQWSAIQSGITSALVGKLSALPTASELSASLDDKVDKVEGKGLSTNDFTNALKTKLLNLLVVNYDAENESIDIAANDLVQYDQTTESINFNLI